MMSTTNDKFADSRTGEELGHHLSESARRREDSPLKSLYKYISDPNLISMAGGMPPAEYFPFETISATTQVANSFKPSTGLVAWVKSFFAAKTTEWTVPKYSTTSDLQLSTALQYGNATGIASLADFIAEFVETVFQPVYPHQTLLNSGATDGFHKVILTLLNPGEGILCEEWSYPSALCAALPYNNPPVALEIDDGGLVPDAMETLLATWDPEAHDGMPRPHVLYTIPVAQNPSGSTMTLARKRRIYDICSRFDVIIVEDDPYYFLQCPAYTSPEERHYPGKTISDAEFLAGLVPSFLRIDHDGRVIRLDTFSKTICPGSRLGFFTCNALFRERLLRCTESCVQQPSGFAQVCVARLLVEEWGMSGYLRWLKGIQTEYRTRRDAMADALVYKGGVKVSGGRAAAGVSTAHTNYAFSLATNDDEKLASASPVLSFVPPQGGMFMWLKIHLANHPHIQTKDSQTLMFDLWKALVKGGVLFVPGSFFNARTMTVPEFVITQDLEGYMRISFSSTSPEDMEKAAKITYKVVTAFFST